MTNVTAISVENKAGMSYATLIPVKTGEIGGEMVQMCNAKDVFLCLRVRSRFNDWIARRISEYGFVENVDFALVTPGKVIKGRGGDRRSKQYDVTLDMAKELALVERGEIAHCIRRYFIACEKALRQIAPEVAADLLRKALSPQQQFTLKEKVDNKVACLAKARQRAGYHEIWSNLKSRHQVAQYRDIAQAEFEDACQYVESYAWEGEWLGKSKASSASLEHSDLVNLNALMVHVDWISRYWKEYRLYDALSAVQSPAAYKMIDHVKDGGLIAGMLRRRLGDQLNEAGEQARRSVERAMGVAA
jgi:phage anti-repressor protein